MSWVLVFGLGFGHDGFIDQVYCGWLRWVSGVLGFVTWTCSAISLWCGTVVQGSLSLSWIAPNPTRAIGAIGEPLPLASLLALVPSRLRIYLFTGVPLSRQKCFAANSLDISALGSSALSIATLDSLGSLVSITLSRFSLRPYFLVFLGCLRNWQGFLFVSLSFS